MLLCVRNLCICVVMLGMFFSLEEVKKDQPLINQRIFFPLPKVPSLAGHHVHGMPVSEAEGSSHSLPASSEGCGPVCRPLVGIHAHR